MPDISELKTQRSNTHNHNVAAGTNGSEAGPRRGTACRAPRAGWAFVRADIWHFLGPHGEKRSIWNQSLNKQWVLEVVAEKATTRSYSTHWKNCWCSQAQIKLGPTLKNKAQSVTNEECKPALWRRGNNNVMRFCCTAQQTTKMEIPLSVKPEKRQLYGCTMPWNEWQPFKSLTNH